MHKRPHVCRRQDIAEGFADVELFRELFEKDAALVAMSADEDVRRRPELRLARERCSQPRSRGNR
jgi:hypothetical protein